MRMKIIIVIPWANTRTTFHPGKSIVPAGFVKRVVVTLKTFYLTAFYSINFILYKRIVLIYA